MSEASPEKAGVGGSIPSLATMFSVTCRTALPPTYSISFPIPSIGLPVLSLQSEAAAMARASLSISRNARH